MSPIKLKNVLSRKTISACGVFSPSVLCHLVVQLFPCCCLVVYSVFTLWLSYETKVGTQHPTYWCCHLASLWNLADVFAFGSVVGKHLSSRLLTQQLKVPPVASFRTSLRWAHLFWLRFATVDMNSYAEVNLLFFSLCYHVLINILQ